MNLSLEVKKFMNNEHTGDYVTVILPSELPIERSEVREVNRDKTAANTAKSVADNKARIASKAKERAANTEKLRDLKEEELNEANLVLEEIVSQQKAMQPELDEKRALYDEAKADYDEKNSIYNIRREHYEAREKAYSEAQAAERQANLLLNECRANYSGAETALAAAKEDGQRHEGLMSSAGSDVAEAKVLAEKARAEAKEASDDESEKNSKYMELSDHLAQLLAILKKETKRLTDAQKNLTAASREYTKAAADHSSMTEAVTAAENMVKDSSRADKDALRQKAASLRSRLAAAAARLENAEAYKADAEQALDAAEETHGRAEINYNKVYEIAGAAKAELDEQRAKAAAAAARAAEAEAKYSSLSSSFERSRNDVETSVRDVRDREAGLLDSKKALLNAETDLKRRSEDTVYAKEETERARAEMEEKRSVMLSSEKVYNLHKAAFDAINSNYQMAERDRRTQKNICDRLATELSILKNQLEDDIAARDAAVEDAEESSAEAQRRISSVRTLNARNETAKIHYVREGKGEDIILIHSVGQSLYTFRELISKLSGKFRVTALDMVGAGYSERPFYFNYTIPEMADFIARFMDALEMETAHIFGFSMGAGYVVEFAKRYPERCGKVVLLSPGGITPEMPSSIRSIENRLFGGISARMINLKAVKKMLLECFFDLTHHTQDLVEEYYKPIASPEAKRVIRACIMNYDDEEVIRSLRDVNADTLLLWGNEDKWHPTDMSNMFRAVMPKVNYTLVRNAGHLAHEEKAERIAQLIKLFIPCGYDEEA